VTITGAEMVIKSLLAEGVEVVFGFPGGAVLPLYDALFDSPLKHILVRHEQGAVHAADGYSRSTGRPGVCIVTSGPGGTNTVTGIATAYMDSIPMVIFTGQVNTVMIGNDAFQEADIVGITRPCTKHNYLVRDVKELPRIIKEAFYIATTGKPGPVLIDLPKDVLNDRAPFRYPDRVELRGYKPVTSGHPVQIQRAAEAIAAAKRPVLLVGGGVIRAKAAAELRSLAELTTAPVALTLMGLDAFPGTHPQALGMVGMHGTFQANMALQECDLLVGIGVRFDDRVTGKLDEFSVRSKKIHIDIDRTSINKNVPVEIPIVGDCASVLAAILAELAGMPRNWAGEIAPWRERLDGYARTHPLSYSPSATEIKPQYVVEQILDLTRGKAIIATEVGQNQMWTAQYYKFDHPLTWLTSGGLGTMGYGLPAAIGAQVGNPGALVIDVAGDGSIQMNIQELATAVANDLHVKIIILNNQFLGMVRQWQELFYERRYSYTCMKGCPDFVKLAEAYGAVGLRATRPEEVRPTLEKAFATPATVVVDMVVSQEENVYPMVPAGAPISKMLLV
jgi:acetolactate synthase-1/2/3 large subunit